MLASVRRVGRTNKEQVKAENHLLQKKIENKGPWRLTTLICESKQAKQSPLCQSLGRRLDRAAVEQLSLLSGWHGPQAASLADAQERVMCAQRCCFSHQTAAYVRISWCF